jgi:alpha-galactosidase
MSQAQHALVADAVRVYKAIRRDIAVSVPFWPLGLPRWTDEVIALGLRARETSYLTVWRRPPLGTADPGPSTVTLPVPHLRGRALSPRMLYPADGPARATWDAEAAVVSVTLPAVPSACLLAL